MMFDKQKYMQRNLLFKRVLFPTTDKALKLFKKGVSAFNPSKLNNKSFQSTPCFNARRIGHALVDTFIKSMFRNACGKVFLVIKNAEYKLCVQRINMFFACILREIILIGNKCHKVTPITNVIGIKAKVKQGFNSGTLFRLAACDVYQKNSRYSRAYNSDCLHNQNSVSLDQPSQSSLKCCSKIIENPFSQFYKLPHLCRHSSSGKQPLQITPFDKQKAIGSLCNYGIKFPPSLWHGANLRFQHWILSPRNGKKTTCYCSLTAQKESFRDSNHSSIKHPKAISELRVASRSGYADYAEGVCHKTDLGEVRHAYKCGLVATRQNKSEGERKARVFRPIAWFARFRISDKWNRSTPRFDLAYKVALYFGCTRSASASGLEDHSCGRAQNIANASDLRPFLFLLFDKQKAIGLTYAASDDSSSRFSILLMLVRIVTILFGGFFYARSFSSLYGGLGGRASARRFRCHGILIPFNLPPEFSISVGRNLTTRSSS